MTRWKPSNGYAAARHGRYAMLKGEVWVMMQGFSQLGELASFLCLENENISDVR
jgi:hypothetical protein